MGIFEVFHERKRGTVQRAYWHFRSYHLRLNESVTQAIGSDREGEGGRYLLDYFCQMPFASRRRDGVSVMWAGYHGENCRS